MIICFVIFVYVISLLKVIGVSITFTIVIIEHSNIQGFITILNGSRRSSSPRIVDKVL